MLSYDALALNPSRLANNLLSPEVHVSNVKSISGANALLINDHDTSHSKKVINYTK